MVDHTIVHFEIPVNDVEKLRRFYSELFGWKIEKVPSMEYWLIETVPVDENMTLVRPGVNGGMMKKEQPNQTPLNYISVEDIDKYVEKIGKLGGKVVMPKQRIEGVGWVALGLDPEGNPIAMLQGEM